MIPEVLRREGLDNPETETLALEIESDVCDLMSPVIMAAGTVFPGLRADTQALNGLDTIREHVGSSSKKRPQGEGWSLDKISKFCRRRPTMVALTPVIFNSLLRAPSCTDASSSIRETAAQEDRMMGCTGGCASGHLDHRIGGARNLNEKNTVFLSGVERT